MRRVRVHVDEPAAVQRLAGALRLALQEHRSPGQPIVLVCIGTDRSTGDSLGPLVGTMLSERALRDVAIYGTLEDPVHAANLSGVLEAIQLQHHGALVIAVDACLGRSENVGTISVKEGPLQPGTGVNKTLPEVGVCHVIGVVNVGGFMEYFVLQNTRLGLVVRMATAVADSVAGALGAPVWDSSGTRSGFGLRVDSSRSEADVAVVTE